MKREKGHKNLQYIYILFIFQFQVRPAFDSEDFLPKKRCMNLRVPEIWTASSKGFAAVERFGQTQSDRKPNNL